MKKEKRDFKKILKTRNFFYITCALISLFSLVLLSFGKERSFTADVLFVAGAYVILCVVYTMIYRIIEKSGQAGEIEPLLGNMTLDLMLKLDMPVIISDENDKIIWYNKAFTILSGSGRGYFGKTIEQVCNHTISEILDASQAEGLQAVSFERFFNIKGYMISTPNKNYCISVWRDATELNNAYSLLADRDTVVAYIMIDNIDELLQYVQEQYRAAATDVALILRKYADSSGGILKEYERDKYLFIFDSSRLNELVASKFDILDSVRNVRVGESSLPITISIGVARIKGTLAEKEKAAHSALDMALQRGGDQAVLKNDENMEFYGGRTKTVQKRTKVRARVVANELAMLMAKSDNVLVMGHKNPDFDSIGASAGIARLALYCGVEVNIVVNTSDGNMKKCYEKLTLQPEYRDMLVDPADAQELVRPDTLLVIVDVNNRPQFESPDIADAVDRVVYIDHHRKTAEFKNDPEIAYIEPSASSASELVAEILEQSLPAGNLPKEEADLLLAGILLDTKQFSKNTGVRTFSAALYLRNEGASPQEAQLLFRSELDEIIREAKFESNVVIYRKVIAISTNETDVNGAGSPHDRIAAAKAADKLLTVNGIKASFALCRIEDSIHISARSSGSINVQVILERLEGGGHYDAAATQLKNISMAEALTRLKKSIDGYLE